jgi:hypothetical protein
MLGEGNFHWLDGSSYEGSYLEDKKNGSGKFLWPNGS